MVMTVRVIAPDKTVWDAPAEEVILPSTTGQLGILANHAPLLTALETGVMRVRSGKDWLSIALMGGFAEVENNELTVLVNGAIRGDTINLDQAKADYTNAKEQLAKTEQGDSRQAKFQATQAFRQARAKLQAAGGSVEL
ncbi:ATP synthase F1 subunit epsilon [Thermosynechococcaceae cyanobacterium BACA0444]|uniref:ATP synthase epsilon chain n=1 Tax=Pseudocalidococcus azoricus BACA0444 TaxID=2918990 RepID=A0AAE4FVZ7_9CYAN|nr:ATP synthase F1 subunit epsilon [Pseudocalidococcus azoricus]MDS3862071.1 ATP synthase F1 subunit epsilon [Pseudocalidococcus azoricus BACA0444]